MKKRRFQILLVLAVCLVTYSMLMGDTAWAASDPNMDAEAQYTYKMDFSGLNADFNKELKKIFHAFMVIVQVLLIVMTSVAAIMVGFGIEDGKKTLWNWILGIGLVFNFTSVLMDFGFFDMFTTPTQTTTSAVDKLPNIKIATKDEAGTMGFLADFMKTYLDGIIKPGAKAILPYCDKLLLVLAAMEAGWEISFKLISGDKIKYLLTMVIKIGFFMWLMSEWIYLTEALGNGFQQLGFIAGGSPELQANSIGDNADKMVSAGFQIFSAIWDKSSIFDGVGLVFLTVMGIFAILGSVFFTALEMFMARIEFYTMAILALPLLPFIVTSKFSFLADKAIGAMFNLAIKLCCISFVTAFAVPFYTSFVKKFQEASGAGASLSAILQTVLASLVLYFLVKKMPQLVTGLLNGQPQLSGQGMVDMAKSAAGKTAAVVSTATGTVGAIRGAAAIARGKGKGGALGTLSQLGKAAVMSRGPVQSYRNAMQKMDSLVGAGRHSASNMRTNMRLGKDAAGRSGTDEATKNNLEITSADIAKRNSVLSPREQRQYEQLTRKFNEMMDRKYPKGKK